MFGNVRLVFGTILENLRKSSGSGRKSSENHQKCRHQYVLYNKKEHYTLARRYEFSVLVTRTIFLPLEHKIHIFSPPCNILYIYRKMMALPFLPEREIRPMFEALHNEASGTLLEFADYVSSTWISSSTWKPTDWTCYKQAIRTNDIEGWYHGLNHRASGRTQLPLYLLIQLLHREARLTAIQIRLASEKKLRRIQLGSLSHRGTFIIFIAKATTNSLTAELRSLRSMTTSFQTTSFHPLVTSFHQVFTSFQTIVTSF